MSVKEAQRTVVWVHSHWDTHYAGATLLCLHYLSTARIATDTLTSADRFFLCISSGIKSLTLPLYAFFELHLLETHDVNIKIIKRIVNINSVVNFLFLFFIFISFTFSSVILYLH